MKVRLLFGKPLPAKVWDRKNVSLLSWLGVFALAAGAGLASWMAVRLVRRNKRGMGRLIYF